MNMGYPTVTNARTNPTQTGQGAEPMGSNSRCLFKPGLVPLNFITKTLQNLPLDLHCLNRIQR